MSNHIVSVGAVYIDTILSVPKYPIEDQKLRATDHARRRGGNCANTLEVLSQLVFLLDKHDAEVPTQLLSQESRLHLLTVLPNEESAATKFIRGSLNGVDVSSCIFRSEFTEAAASYILQNAQNYSRTIISHNSLPEMTTQEFIDKAAELSQPDYGQGGWYHFEGRVPEITVQCVEYMRSALKQRGWKISVECEKPERGGLVEAAKIADVVFYSRLWADAQGYDDPRTFLESQIDTTIPEAMLCCTWGEGGAVAVQKNVNSDHEWTKIAAWKPDTGTAQVIDTIGAGDTFIAGMLFALAHYPYDWSINQKVAFSNELAGRKVLQDGFAGLGEKMRHSSTSQEE